MFFTKRQMPTLRLTVMETGASGVGGDNAGVTCILASGLELMGNSAAPVNLPEPLFPRLPTGMGQCWLREVREVTRRHVSNMGLCNCGSEVVSEKQGHLISLSRREYRCVWEPDFYHQSVSSLLSIPLDALQTRSHRSSTHVTTPPVLTVLRVLSVQLSGSIPRCRNGTTISTVSRAFPSSWKDTV